MSTELYPDTGLELNPVPIRRVGRSYRVALTAHLMRLRGETHQRICQRIGIDARRLGQIFKLRTHPKAAREALEIVERDQPSLPL